MNSKKMKLAGYILFISTSFVISTIFTILLMTSTVSSRLEYNLVVGMAIILQLSTTLFVAKALLDKNINIVIRITMLCISILLLFASIVANVGLIQNNANKTRNKELKQSTQYQEAEKQNTRQQQLYDAKLKEIENTTSTYDLSIAQTKDTIEKSNAAWERNKHTDTLKNLTKEKTERLKELNAELNNINISPITITNTEIKSENGYYSTFEFFSQVRIVKWLFKDASPYQLQNYFFIMLSSVFEFINMIALYLLSVFMGTNISFKKSTTPDPAPKQKIPTPTPSEIKPKLNLIKSETSLGLKARSNFNLKNTPKNLNNSDIKKYIDFMNKTAENVNGKLVSRGRTYISKNIGIKDSEGRKIVGWLENEGIIKVEDGKTIIVKKQMAG